MAVRSGLKDVEQHLYAVTRQGVIAPPESLAATVAEQSAIISYLQRQLGDLAMRVGRAVQLERIIDGLCVRELAREDPKRPPSAIIVSTSDILEKASYEELRAFANDISRTGSQRLSLRDVLRSHGAVITYTNEEPLDEDEDEAEFTPSSPSSGSDLDTRSKPSTSKSQTFRHLPTDPASIELSQRTPAAAIPKGPGPSSAPPTRSAPSTRGTAGRSDAVRGSAPRPTQSRGKLPPLGALPGRPGSLRTPAATDDPDDLDVEAELSGGVKGIQGLGTPTPEGRTSRRMAETQGGDGDNDVEMYADADERAA